MSRHVDDTYAIYNVLGKATNVVVQYGISLDETWDMRESQTQSKSIIILYKTTFAIFR